MLQKNVVSHEDDIRTFRVIRIWRRECFELGQRVFTDAYCVFDNDKYARAGACTYAEQVAKQVDFLDCAGRNIACVEFFEEEVENLIVSQLHAGNKHYQAVAADGVDGAIDQR